METDSGDRSKGFLAMFAELGVIVKLLLFLSGWLYAVS